MNFWASVALGMIVPPVATFFLFALAFTRSWSELRLAVLPIYARLLFTCAVVVWLSPKSFFPGVAATLSLPVLMLFYFGSQNSEFFLHAAVILSVVSAMCWRFSRMRGARTFGRRTQKDWE